MAAARPGLRYVVCALCRRWSGTVSTQQWIPDVNSVHSEALVRPRSSDNGRGRVAWQYQPLKALQIYHLTRGCQSGKVDIHTR